MNQKQQLDKMWREMEAISVQMSVEARLCHGSPTKRYKNLRADMDKLKTEYEALKKGGSMDPANQRHLNIMSKRTFMQKMLGKTGDDSHNSLEDPT